ncbi:MAG: EAL domain-containing protein [Motiliproteus sp.]
MAFGLSAQRIKQALHESESKFRLMAEASMVGVYMIQDGLFVYSNPYMAQAFGYSVEQLTGLSVADLVAPSDLDRVLENLRRRNTGEVQSLGYEFTGSRADGEIIQVEVFGSATVFNGKPCVVGTLIDITERQLLEQRLLLMERAIESSNNGIAISDLQQHDNPYIYVNPAFEQITGYQSEEILGRNGRVLLNGDTDQLAVDKLKQALHGKQSVEVVLRNYKRNGDMFWNDLSMAPVRDGEADATHFISIINDISESKQYEQQLEQLSYYDSLTGLANKTLLRDRLQQSIIQSSRSGRHSALLLLDLDRFKMLNQSLGYSATDEVLKTTARRIANTVRQGDTVARLGADDFAVVLHDLRDVADVVAITQQLMSAVSKPLDSGPEGMIITCSIGIAVYPQDGGDGEALLRNAEAAQFKAMENRNSFRFYTPEYNDRAQDRLTMEMELGKALERQEFVLHYQPKVDLASGTINGAEALIRWQHPERGLVPPTEFIPLAEDTGLITQIGAWAMQQACETIQQINQRCDLSLQIAVNLSAKQFSDSQLPQIISRTLSASGLEPELLECELTESMLMDDPDGALDIMRRLKKIGVAVALDDFGTGYSSLSYLKRFPIDTLKIDRSFVQDIPGDAQDMAIARAIIALAETLDLYVVAEGVETQEQQDFLQHERCNSMQGYLFSRPLPEDEFEALLLEKLQQQWDSDY